MMTSQFESDAHSIDLLNPPLLAISSTSKLLSVSQETIRRWIRSGVLKDVGPGCRCLITMKSIEDLLDS